MISDNIKAFLVALQFMTQVPVRFKRYPVDRLIGRSVVFYPLIGLLMGAALAALGYALAGVASGLAAALLLVFWIAASGALHLDGLADCADAWIGGHGNRARALEIMKDPAAGPIAVVVLLAVLLLKWTALEALIAQQMWCALVAAPLIARSLLPGLLLATPYARKMGLATLLLKHAPRAWVWASLALGLAFSLYHWPLAVICALITCWLLRQFSIRWLGGATGDTLGASVELIELVVLVSLALAI